jgi:hypothetical protein
MSHWQLHWLEAEGDLHPWRKQIASEVASAHDVVSQLLPTPHLDILVQRYKGALVIPEIGMVGHALREGLLSLTVDPSSPRFGACLADGTLRRQVAHEVHHCLRMGGPGYGQTLGEALVSEGLAGRFVGHLFGSRPEPWECAVRESALQRYWPDVSTLSSKSYDHASWFFGRGGQRPRWLGYTLGYLIVGKWLEAAGLPNGKAWIDVPAPNVLAATWADYPQPILFPS